MNHLFGLAWRSAWNRRLTLGLVLASITLSVVMLLGVLKLKEEAHRSFDLSVSGIDLVVGARTSQMQLMLYAVFRIGEANHNIRWKSYLDIASDPLVDWAVPISLGDSHHGFPVIGTTEEYFRHFSYGDEKKLAFVQGNTFSDVFDVVIGSEVARRLGYAVGDKIVLEHGMEEAGSHEHEDKPFTITGILAPTGTPVDRTLHVQLQGMSAIHLDWAGGAPMPGFSIPGKSVRKFDLTPSEVTAVLVGLKQRATVFRLQRQLNEYAPEPLLAAMPGVAMEQLWQVAALAENTMLAISALVVLVGLSGMTAVLLASLNERRREIAILRSVGASPADIVLLLLGESVLVTLAGILLALLILFLAASLFSPWLQANYGIALRTATLSMDELQMLAAILLMSAIAGLAPALRAYRLSLSDGLIPRL